MATIRNACFPADLMDDIGWKPGVAINEALCSYRYIIKVSCSASIRVSPALLLSLSSSHLLTLSLSLSSLHQSQTATTTSKNSQVYQQTTGLLHSFVCSFPAIAAVDKHLVSAVRRRRQRPVDSEGKNIISSNITAIRSEYQVNTVGALISDSALETREAGERAETTSSNQSKCWHKKIICHCNKFITYRKVKAFNKGSSSKWGIRNPGIVVPYGCKFYLTGHHHVILTACSHCKQNVSKGHLVDRFLYTLMKRPYMLSALCPLEACCFVQEHITHYPATDQQTLNHKTMFDQSNLKLLWCKYKIHKTSVAGTPMSIIRNSFIPDRISPLQ